MTVFLQGIAIGGYRGIGPEQRIGPFDRFNFFAGPNNSGKSTVLDFIFLQYGSSSGSPSHTLNFEPTRKHIGAKGSPPAFGICVDKTDALHEVNEIALGTSLDFTQALSNVVNAIAPDDELWFDYDPDRNEFRFFQNIDPNVAGNKVHRDTWYSLWTKLTRQTGGGLIAHWIPETLARLDESLKQRPPPCHLLPAVRSIGPSGEDFEGLGGKGIIDHLQELQNPPFDRQEMKQRFQAINRLLRAVIRKPDAQIEIPHNKESIIVHLDNKSLPLSEFGTGIEEVIMIGAYCTIYDGSIMCLEEPELHLHPILQRELLEYLRKETTSQYFISTHSAAFLDMPNGRVFSVSNNGEHTTVKSLLTRASRRLLTDQLGYKPSDLVQSNAVIWVEGPSDRLYLLNWLEQLDAALIEGIHFSIMFYGGRLLSHLSGDPEKLDEFINLRSLNQHSAIVIDSDKGRPRKRVNGTKQRIVEEFDSAGGVAWITKGREIENYLDANRLKEALREAHPKTFGELGDFDDYSNRLVFKHAETGEPTTANKMKVAELMCAEPLTLDFLDLKARVNEVYEFIKTANSLD